ncbi:outer membrane lipoprotein-sorting protein [Thermoproteota archaeon]
MSRLIVLIISAVFSLAVFNINAIGETLSGQEIMERSFTRYDGDDSYFKIEMSLIDKKGGERVRELEIHSKDYGALIKTFLEFSSPADIDGTCFLSWENEGRDDTQYLYLPELKRARRIVTSQKKISFVNTDYTYEDMQRRYPVEDDHVLLRVEGYLGRICFVVESTPVDNKNSQYTKRVSWVDMDSFVVLKTEFYDKKRKVFKQFRVEQLEKRKDIWTNIKTCMQDFDEGHATTMTVLEVDYNRGLDDELFSLRRLEEE